MYFSDLILFFFSIFQTLLKYTAKSNLDTAVSAERIFVKILNSQSFDLNH